MSGQEKKRFSFFFFLLRLLLLFYLWHQTLYGTVLQHDKAGPYASLHTTQFLANNNAQTYPVAFHVPILKPRQAHLERAAEKVFFRRGGGGGVTV